MFERDRFFCAQYLPKTVVHVDYYHGKRSQAVKVARALADKHAKITKEKPDVKSGRYIKNSWEIMAEQGYILG